MQTASAPLESICSDATVSRLWISEALLPGYGGVSAWQGQGVTVPVHVLTRGCRQEHSPCGVRAKTVMDRSLDTLSSLQPSGEKASCVTVSVWDGS